jgi:hypothetical protein
MFHYVLSPEAEKNAVDEPRFSAPENGVLAMAGRNQDPEKQSRSSAVRDSGECSISSGIPARLTLGSCDPTMRVGWWMSWTLFPLEPRITRRVRGSTMGMEREQREGMGGERRQ